jgi:photosystem II stability/assembly factor-like uncharacterized protein
VAQPIYKGIWSRQGYAEDLRFIDVFFVNADVGWIAGAAGTILHTTDGGSTWNPQLGGDATSPEPEICCLRFVDERHGWAYQRKTGKLFRTTDGESWEQIGSIPTLADYAFSSATNGAYVLTGQPGDRIYHTDNSGRTWREVVSTCAVSGTVHGVIQTTNCAFSSVTFASPTVGFATGGAWHGEKTLFVLKTEDGGLTWPTGTMVPNVSASTMQG